MEKEQKPDKFKEQKTTVSIVTPFGEGGIGKIVVSGQDALSIVNKVFQGKGIADLREALSHKLYYGHIHHRGQRIDEVVLHIMKQRDSFTGKDEVEVNCHGGIRVLISIYECIESTGAEGAPWTSLLSQSLENNKIDLVQKEALQEIVQARTKLGVKVLLDQYAGALSAVLRKGLEIIGGIRQSLNKNESYHNGAVHPHLSRKRQLDNQSLNTIPSSREGRPGVDNRLDENDASVSALTDTINSLLKTASFGMALTAPQVLVILGKPNVGKSTIINAILGEERMLVHHEPGTTRDYVSEFIAVDGVPFELVDTAGMRDTNDMLEAMSIELTQEQLRRADKVLVVFDNSRPFDREDEGILGALNSWLTSKISGDLPQKVNTPSVIHVINKCDLPAKLDRLRIESALYQPICSLSALNKEGFDNLNRRLVQEFDTAYKPMRPLVFNERQYLLLAEADVLLKQAQEYLIAKNKPGKTLHVIDKVQGIFTACLKGSQ